MQVTKLLLQHNDLSGPLPNWDKDRAWAKLKEVDLSFNQFYGEARP
jgi:hypothetical protein